MKDLRRAQQLIALSDTFLEFAEDRAFFAGKMADYWRLQAETETRIQARRPRQSKTPSGTFTGVHEALSRAKTEAHNPGKLLEEARAADVEHRDTPVVGDPRKEQ